MKDEKFKKWLKEADDDEYSAYCSICKNSFDVGNIRMPALTSHGSGAKHKRLLAAENSNIRSITKFLIRAPEQSSALPLIEASKKTDEASELEILVKKQWTINEKD